MNATLIAPENRIDAAPAPMPRMRNSITARATEFTGEVEYGHEFEAAGLNYEAVKIQNEFEFNGERHKGIDFQIVRSDNGKSIGCVGKNYQVLQNSEVFQPVIETAHKVGAQYDGGGLVFGGSSAWMSFRLPFEIAIKSRPDDKMGTNIIVFNNFEGKSNAFISIFTTRWFCMNQMRAIKRFQKELKEKASEFIYKIRHNSKGSERLKIAQTSFEDAIVGAQSAAEFLAYLDEKPMDLGQMRNFVAELLPVKSEDDDEPSTRLENQRDQIVGLFTRGAGNLGRSRYDAMQAVTEWTNHLKTGKETSGKKESHNRLVSTLVPGGQNDRLMVQAADLLSV